MTDNDIKKLLKAKFDPVEKISFDDFFYLDILKFYESIEKANECFNLIGVEWTMIDWEKICNITTNGWMIISFLNELSYKHAFPSLVLELKGKSSALVDLFIENHLTISNIYNDWEVDYYLSFDEDLRSLIASLLRKIGNPLSKIALESYWA